MSSGIRRDWVTAVFKECQVAAGCAVPTREAPLGVALGRLVDRLPNPSSPLETVMLRGELLDFCVSWGPTDHRLHHAAERTDHTGCRFDPGALISEHWGSRQGSPKARFRQWLAAYIPAFQASHSLYGARELRRTIECGFHRPLGLPERAAALGMSVRCLQQDFKRLTGATPQEYLGMRRARAAAALLHDTNDKVEWIARTVGWSSRKHLNLALARHAGLSPTAIRASRRPPESAATTPPSLGLDPR
jgi:AraC-like DNA-binding protein